MEKLLAEKIVLITGAARGIGRGIAIEMAEQGADIVIADIDTVEVPKTIAAVEKEGRRVSFFNTDVSDLAAIEKLAKLAWGEFGRINILVNNAGIGAPTGLLNTSVAEWDKVQNTNLRGHAFLTKAIVERMTAQKIEGNIIFITSIHQDVIQSNPAYSVSKAGIKMLIRELAVEFALHKIRVNGIAPGAIKINEECPYENPDIPLGYSGLPEEIGKVAVFLASNWANYITGETITVDGGLSLVHMHWFKQREEK